MGVFKMKDIFKITKDRENIDKLIKIVNKKLK